MAKKVPKRKLNRKAKRLIRRSIAAVLMITAIGVAAIPVPDIQAVDENGVLLAAGPGSSQVKRDDVEQKAADAVAAGNRSRVQYNVTEADYMNDDLRLQLLNPTYGTHADTGNIDRTYKIKQLSNGQWKYNWQFEFYIVNNETIQTELGGASQATGGIISQYNKDYEEEVVELQAVNPLKYYEVPEADYIKFYSAGQPGCEEYRLQYDDYKNFVEGTNVGDYSTRASFFEFYFNKEYTEFIRLCDLYYKDETDGDDKLTAKKPNPLVKIPNNDFATTEAKYQYYCDCTFANGGAEAIANRGALTLVYALDGRTVGTSTGSSYVYLVRLASGKSQSDLIKSYADQEGFISQSQSAEIIGIANNAFKDVTKIETLILPTEIRFIGDSAFEGSFLQNIALTNVSDIGNMTFKNCSRLTTVEIGQAVNVIGAEAFSGSAIASLDFPYSVKKIGAGAFSYCTELKSVDMNKMKAGNNEKVEVGNYAFFDCFGLDNLKMENAGITKIGDGAFATVRTGTATTQGSLDTIVLPQQVSGGNLGDWLFDGRTSLKSVTFPSAFGYSSEAKVPKNTFRGCVNLEEVIFPDYGNATCGFATFMDCPYLFLDVVNPNLVVSGPEKNLNGEIAYPRKSTWKAVSAVSDFIPYKYKNNQTGVDYYEVSDGSYLLTANEQGVLTSCTLTDPDTWNGELTIPSYVGTYKIQSVASDCFADTDLRENVKKILIEDDSVSEISDYTFQECPMLNEVIIGNSVTKIGTEAFEGCDKLINVTFNTPANGNYSGFVIGTDAFKTNGEQLTFHGDIKENYAPYDWAMTADNYINKDKGIRVCYKSLAPTNLTVLYNNATGERTLVDYPKYSRLDEDNKEFINAMVNTYYQDHLSTDYNTKRDNFKADWNANGEAAYDGEWYGPWVYPTWADSIGAEPYFEHNPYSIIKNYENPGRNEWEALTPMAEQWVNSALKVVVPAGIDSIDAKGYIEESSNSYNFIKYLDPDPDKRDRLSEADHDMYTLAMTDKDGEKSVPGLFSGYYKDYKDDASLSENKYRGNDRVEEIVLESVKWLPDYAFDSCENLKKVTLGSACTDIGNTPFRGCDNLPQVVFIDNPKYTSNKGIIYSINEDGSYTIEECLPYRGSDAQLAPAVINLNHDPDLVNVSDIKSGAFEDCIKVTSVDLTGAPNLTVIPEDAFKNCPSLTRVALSDKVNLIEQGAFEGDKSGLTVTIPSKEVNIETYAFEHSPQVTIRSYKDTAAYRYADLHGLNWEDLASTFSVVFVNYDGTQIGETQYIEEGKSAIPPEMDPVWEGHTFIGWSGDYTGVTKDLILVAQFKQNDDGTGGGGTGGGTDKPGKPGDGSDDDIQTDGKSYTVTVIGGSGGGSYLSGSTVKIVANDPASGKKFSHWASADGVGFANTNSATTSFTMPKKDVIVTATFDSKSSTGSNNGNGTVSGNDSNGNDNSSGTKVTINKPGFSNENMSSATVNGSTDNFIVRISESAEATQAVEAALIAEYGSLENIQYFPMDITLWDSTGTRKITDTTGLSVDITVPIPDALTKYAGNNKTAGVVNDRLDKLSPKFTTIDGVSCVTFRAMHFSPYVIYVDTNNLTAGTIDSTPQTGDGIHPKWFLAMGLASLSLILFLKKDKVQPGKARLA